MVSTVVVVVDVDVDVDVVVVGDVSSVGVGVGAGVGVGVGVDVVAVFVVVGSLTVSTVVVPELACSSKAPLSGPTPVGRGFPRMSFFGAAAMSPVSTQPLSDFGK